MGAHHIWLRGQPLSSEELGAPWVEHCQIRRHPIRELALHCANPTAAKLLLYLPKLNITFNSKGVVKLYDVFAVQPITNSCPLKVSEFGRCQVDFFMHAACACIVNYKFGGPIAHHL